MPPGSSPFIAAASGGNHETVTFAGSYSGVAVTQGGNIYHEELLKKYEVKGVPTIVFLDTEGQERTDLRLVDYLPANQFLLHMQRQAYAVILAVGGTAKKLNAPGELENFGKGVFYCATCDGFFFRGKTVAVVGGGDTALEDALYLAKIAKKVYLIHRRDAFRGSRILQQRVFAEPQIEIIYNAVVGTINADGGGVTGISLKDTQTGESRNLDTEGVFIFVGFAPNNQLVPAGIKMNTTGYVVTDEKCETNIAGIFAVGDLRQKYANQIVLAAADGCTAALAAAHYVETRKAVSI